MGEEIGVSDFWHTLSSSPVRFLNVAFSPLKATPSLLVSLAFLTFAESFGIKGNSRDGLTTPAKRNFVPPLARGRVYRPNGIKLGEIENTFVNEHRYFLCGSKGVATSFHSIFSHRIRLGCVMYSPSKERVTLYFLSNFFWLFGNYCTLSCRGKNFDLFYFTGQLLCQVKRRHSSAISWAVNFFLISS